MLKWLSIISSHSMDISWQYQTRFPVSKIKSYSTECVQSQSWKLFESFFTNCEKKKGTHFSSS